MRLIRSGDVFATRDSDAGSMVSPAADDATAVTARAGSRRWTTASAFAFVLAAAVITGALTPFGMIHLPSSLHAVANSSAPWAMVAFATVFFVRARGFRAAVLGLCSFVAMDVAFWVVYEARIGHYPNHYLAFWVGIAIVVGPLVGLCASWLRSKAILMRALGVAAPSSILIGEGAYMLARLPGESTLYAVGCVFAGVILCAVLGSIVLERIEAVLLAFVICASASAVFFAVYSLLPLVLDKTVP